MTSTPYLRITSDDGTLGDTPGGDSPGGGTPGVRTRTATLLVDGELDYETTSDLEAAVRGVLASRPGLRELRLDCGRIRFCDTIGLAGLLNIRRDADNAGVALVLHNRSATLERLLELTGILQHLTGPLDRGGSGSYLGPATRSARTSRPG